MASARFFGSTPSPFWCPPLSETPSHLLIIVASHKYRSETRFFVRDSPDPRPIYAMQRSGAKFETITVLLNLQRPLDRIAWLSIGNSWPQSSRLTLQRLFTVD